LHRLSLSLHAREQPETAKKTNEKGETSEWGMPKQPVKAPPGQYRIQPKKDE
jgi:hypothetical protein